MIHNKKCFNSTETEDIINLYNGGISAVEIADKYKISYTPIYRLLKENNVSIKSSTQRAKKYSLDENVFDNIDSKIKAYWLGLLFADGNNSKNSIRISLKEEDGYILNEFSKLLLTNAPIKTKIIDNENHSNAIYIDIFSKKLSSQLASLGCIESKSLILQPPSIDSELFSSFILGYFDGDGCIYIDKNRYFRGQINITGTKELLLWISDIVKEILDINFYFSQRYPEKNINNWSISLCGSKQVMKFMSWLYETNIPSLIRKKEKYLELVKYKERKNGT